MNVARLTVHRARHPSRNPRWQQRRFYLHVHPRVTHYEIEDDPNVAIRKFTPCGRYIVTFSRSPGVHFVDVYRLRSGYRQTEEFPQSLWKHFFALHFSCQVCRGPRIALNKDFCLFTADARYLLVASTEPTSQPPADDDPEMVHTIRNIEDITIYVIDMETGEVAQTLPITWSCLDAFLCYCLRFHHGVPAIEVLSDGARCCSHKFEADSISLAHNAGFCLRGSMLAVFSSYRQTIHLFRIRETGDLLRLQTIGATCYPDDAMYLSQTRPAGPAQRVPAAALAPPTSLAAILERPAPVPEIHAEATDNSIPGIKHRLLAFLWRRAQSATTNRKAQLRYFHNHFDEYRALCIWKMQLLDDHHLLLKYGSVKYVESRSSDSMGILAFFAVYNFITTEVVNVYENNSEALLRAYEDYAEFFFEDRVIGTAEAGHSVLAPYQISLPSNSFCARDAFRKQLYAARTARNGGPDQSIRRSLSELPVAPQNYRESPYFDLELFSYDEKHISHAERLKHCSDFPVKFYSRASGRVVFRVPTGTKSHSRGPKRLASFLFHPWLPFVITIQHVIHPQQHHSSHTNIHVWA